MGSQLFFLSVLSIDIIAPLDHEIFRKDTKLKLYTRLSKVLRLQELHLLSGL